MARALLASFVFVYSFFYLTGARGFTLTDTEKTANKISTSLNKLMGEVTKYKELQKKYEDNDDYKLGNIDGSDLAKTMKNQLEKELKSKIQSIMTLAKKAEELKANYTWNKKMTPKSFELEFYDSKNLESSGNISLTKEDTFADIPVNLNHSTVHVPTDVYNGSEIILNSAKWTKPMDAYFRQNRADEPSLLWQLFGTSTGVYRVYPGYKWPEKEDQIDFFDHRRRGWYIQGSSSPKDMVILLDLSGSMIGNKLAIVKLAADILLDTLQENDFVNIVVFNNGSRMLCESIKDMPKKTGKCTDELLQATEQNKKYLKELVSYVKAEKIAQVHKGFEKAIQVLKKARKSNQTSSGCIRTINFFTDGVEDNESKETFKVLARDGAKEQDIRIFGYLVGREKGSPYKPVEQFACSYRGFYYTIETLSDVRINVSPYLSVLGRPQGIAGSDRPASWTPIYRDGGGLGLMITVVAPVYDQNYNDRLLGVVGTDVALPQLTKSIPQAQIGVNGYGFAINNNGFIVFHPLLKEEEDPPNIVLSNVNLNRNEEKMRNLTRKLIDRMTGSESLKIRHVYKNLKRVSKERTYNFYYTDISETSFSTALAISELGKFTRNITNMNNNEREKLLAKLTAADGETIMVSPWDICKEIIPKARETTPMYKPTYPDTEDLIKNLTTAAPEDYTKFCNEKLFDNLLYDADKVATLVWNIEVNDTNGYLAAFVGTYGGLTRVLAPGQKNPIDRDVTREQFYERAADFEKDDIVVSAPYKQPESQDDSENVITASTPIFVKKDGKELLAAVVGMQIKDDVLRQVILNNSAQNLCQDNETYSCYLIDEDGYIVSSTTRESTIEVGKHFGVVHGQVMQKMVNNSFYDRFEFVDLQVKKAGCSSGGADSSAMRLMNPLLAVSSYITWVTQTLFWSLVQFNIFNFFSWNSQVSADYSGTSATFCTMGIPFYKANFTNIKKDYIYDEGSCQSDNCLGKFAVSRVAGSNLILVALEYCGCTEKAIAPTKVDFPPFIPPSERYRRLPVLKCFAKSPEESKECGAGCSLSPMKILLMLLMAAYLALAH